MVSVIYRYVTLAQCHIDLSITVLRQLSWGWEGMWTPEAPGHRTVKGEYRGIYLKALYFGS